ncbi:hypothetical protein DVH24_030480 [Malus domestica]|uniref:BZIP domain-containing protein n=1 Tax=Malus domestica TaxID=3750 RepID=A0A498JVQ3_MALDO|nr:hypothetical protein DVH24_030480 [Malus domestica]
MDPERIHVLNYKPLALNIYFIAMLISVKICKVFLWFLSMASSSGTSSGFSSMIRQNAGSESSGSESMIHQNSGSEEDLMALMDQRKRKKMIWNRESARRSRMRKQKHLDDLTGQISQLEKENRQIISSLYIKSQHYMNIEAEKSVLRAQADELRSRLQSLNEIASFLNADNGGLHAAAADISCFNGFFDPLSVSNLNQPTMASGDISCFNEPNNNISCFNEPNNSLFDPSNLSNLNQPTMASADISYFNEPK